MPTYEYRCKACGHDLEAVQAFTDEALTTCPSCGEAQLRKVFGSVGISFKGSGFYKNDSRGSSSTTTTPTEKGGSDGTASVAPAATSDNAPSSAGASSGTAAPSAPKSDAKTA